MFFIRRTIKKGALDAGSGSGAEGTRTPHLLNAIQTLYQMSYSPSMHAPAEAAAVRVVNLFSAKDGSQTQFKIKS
jgi:hypothetical protein